MLVATMTKVTTLTDGRVDGAGQLGIGGQVDRVLSPQAVKVISPDGKEVKVKMIAAGGRHSVALCSDGHVYCWGCSKNGRCGNGDKIGSRVETPQMLSIEVLKKRNDMTVTSIACGWSHTLIVLTRQDGNATQIYSFGRGSFGISFTFKVVLIEHTGQCGLGTDDIYVPKQIKSLASVRIAQVAAGYYHTVCLSQDGKVYTFGGGSEGINYITMSS